MIKHFRALEIRKSEMEVTNQVIAIIELAELQTFESSIIDDEYYGFDFFSSEGKIFVFEWNSGLTNKIIQQAKNKENITLNIYDFRILNELKGGKIQEVLYHKDINLIPQEASLKFLETPDAILIRAAKKAKDGFLQEALAECDRAVILNPLFIKSYLYRGQLKYSAKDYIGSSNDASYAILIDPAYYKGYWIRAHSRFALQNYNESFEDLKTVINLGYVDYNVYFILGNICFINKRFLESIEYYTLAIRYSSNSNVFYKRGEAWVGLEDYEQSLNDFTSAIIIKPQFDYFFYRGFVNIKLNKFIDSLEDFNSALEINKESGKTFLFRAYVKHKTGDLKGSREDFNKYKIRKPSNLEPLKGIINFLEFAFNENSDTSI